MLHAREVPEEKRHAELWDSGTSILLELIRVDWVMLGGEYLHRDSDIVDVTLGKKRRVADRDTVHQWRLVLAGSEAEGRPPAITESDCGDEGVYEVNLDQFPGVDSS